MNASSSINRLLLVNDVEAFEPSAHLIDSLSAAQKARLPRLSKARQKNYILSRCLLLHSLRLQHPHLSEHWKITDRPEMPPLIFHPAFVHNLSFSISHSGKWLGIVMFDNVTQGGSQLGLDIEMIKPTRSIEAAAYFCNDKQLDELARLKDELE